MSYQIIQGNCLEVLRTLESESVDSCVTDPPYELGFMGKAWDKSGIAYNVDLWREVLRVLKPGGYLLAFGGTRTYHRMACAIEDAGFEIRDQIQWIYGCLSDDTEVLTRDGWKPNHKDILNHRVLCYNVENEGFEFHAPTRHFSYANKHTAYRIESDSTDQLVSRNHRVIVERGGRKEFVYAEALEREARVPVLESLSDLPDTVYDFHERASVAKQDLLESVQNSDTRQPKASGDHAFTHRSLSGLRQRISDKARQALGDVRVQMQRRASRSGVGNPRPQRTQSVDTRIRGRVHRANDRRHKPRVERWRHLYAEKGLLLQRCVDQICSLSKGIYLNGSERRLCYGTSAFSGSGDWSASNTDRNGTPRRSQPNEQFSQQSRPLCDEPRSQTVRGSRSTASTLARVTPVEYNGNVWCVEVPTGAFVARRNGKIFITGNSGFPKSLDVSKAIDKMNGVDREIIGTRRGGSAMKINGDNPRPWHERQAARGGEYDVSMATSDDAKTWDGWGTALKPAHEPICMARKPLEKGMTVAQNVLKWGTGAINIDGCRISTDESLEGGATGKRTALLNMGGINSRPNHSRAGEIAANRSDTQARFPANVIHDGSDEVVACFPQSTSGANPTKRSSAKFKNAYGTFNGQEECEPARGSESGSAARFFYSAKASHTDRSNGGTVNNTHPTVKPTDLMEYLCRLITRPGGLVLDPFMGSGTTLKAAMIGRFRAIGIELNPDYIAIAEKRLSEIQVNLF